MQRACLLDVVIRKRAAILELFACKDQVLLIRTRRSLLVAWISLLVDTLFCTVCLRTPTEVTQKSVWETPPLWWLNLAHGGYIPDAGP